MIRGVKHANIYYFNDAKGGLEQFLALSNIQPTTMEVLSQSLDDLGITLGECLGRTRLLGH